MVKTLIKAIRIIDGVVEKLWVEMPKSIEAEPMGEIDGENQIFTTTYKIADFSDELFINGLKQIRGRHFAKTGDHEITIADAPLAGDEIIIKYTRGY